MSVVPQVIDVIMAFSTEKNYYKLLNTILIKMMEFTNADGGTLYVLEDGKLHYRIMRNKSMNVFRSATDEINLPPIVLDLKNVENVSAYCALNNKIVNIENVYESTEFNFSGPKNFDSQNGYMTRSMLVLPLTATSSGRDEVIGVMQLINAIDPETGEIKPFGDIYDPPVLPALANISANTLANVKFSKELAELFDSLLRVMTGAIDERSHYNHNHTNNVAKYCAALVDYLNTRYPAGHEYYFDQNRREQLVLAALLHDLGKIVTPLEVMDKESRLGSSLPNIELKLELRRCQIKTSMLEGLIDEAEYHRLTAETDNARELIISSNAAGFLPDDVLERLSKLDKLTYIDSNGKETAILSESNLEALSVRRGTLTKAERLIMQEHVSITKRLLDKITFNSYYKDVTRWARAHHEFLDGSGYPEGLKGSEIPIEAAMLSIIDIYDALTADDRPYKKPLPREKSLGILRQMASEGKLHSELVELFIESGAAEQ